MAQATLSNQQKIITSNRVILAHQKKILQNQDRLRPILANQVKIMRTQEAIVQNQRKILADHAKRFREIASRATRDGA